MIEVLSPGRIYGKVKIIRDINQLKEEDISGKVIVIEKVTTAESIYLYNVNGIIVEVGSKLSHVAIFAREIGLPCVKIENAMELYKDGDIVDIK
jgi:phosphohistidine swiveling domain-containing protein